MNHITTYVAPYASLPAELVATLNLPKAPPVPPCLEELERYEKFGFPNPGTWMDQPADWLEDVQAAERGRWRATQQQRQPSTSDIFRNAPVGETL